MTVYATNLEYDLINLFGNRFDLLDLRFKASGSVIVSAKLRGTRVRFYDTLNHSPSSVASLGEHVGLPKLKMNLASWEYVDRDALITQRFAAMMQDAYLKLGCGFYATLPSSAMDLFRRKYLQFPVKQPNLETLEFLYGGYYGGRTEAYWITPQSGPIFDIDVNSMYSSVMQNIYPNPNTFAQKQTLPDSGFGIADCSISLDTSYFPPLPFRTTKLIFPIGRFRGTWTFPELWYLQECGGRIEKVHRSLHYATGCKPFDAYVSDLYAIKRNAETEIDRYAAKLFLNSLYGKFAERLDVVELVGIADLRPEDAAICYGPFAFVNRGITYPNHTNVIWSAYTTAYSRIKLHREMERLRRCGGRVLYCDTDSVIYAADRPLHVVGSGLGEWSEKGIYTSAHFLGPKLYSLGDGSVVRAKGVPRAQAPEYFERGTASFQQPLRLRTILREQRNGTFWREFCKVRRSPYTKRKVLDNGDTVAVHLNRGAQGARC